MKIHYWTQGGFSLYISNYYKEESVTTRRGFYSTNLCKMNKENVL